MNPRCVVYADESSYSILNLRGILMTKKTCDIFFDLHNVLVDPSAVRKNYNHYIEQELLHYGYSKEDINDIHEQAFTTWLSEILELTQSFDNEYISSTSFMNNYAQIDKMWEKQILDKIPASDREKYSDYFSTHNAEFNAMVKGPYAMLYPDTIPNLTQIKRIKNTRLHVASSASSTHVKGVLTRHDLMEFFVGKIGYDTVSAPKKSHTLTYFHKMLKIVNANPDTSIYVGDSIEEYTLTKKIGVMCVLISRNPINKFPTPQINTSLVLDNLDGLTDIIDRVIHFK